MAKIVVFHRRSNVLPAHIAPRTSPSFDQRPRNDALVEASGKGDLPTVKRLLDTGVSPNAGSGGDEGCSALSAAAANGNISVVRLLLERGADVNADNFWGGNALVGASLFGDVDIVMLLFAKGADPNMEDDGATALDYASHQLAAQDTTASIGHYRTIVQILVENGAHAAGATNLLDRILFPFS